MIYFGVFLAVVSGIFNGLFTTPMKLIPAWKWEQIWMVFIVVACLIMPAGMVALLTPGYLAIFSASPGSALTAALCFGFCWGFGAILFGLSVDRLGVSLANSMVIGLSSALGSLVPLLLQRQFQLNMRLLLLLLGIATFLIGVALCGIAGRKREGESGSTSSAGRSIGAYFFCVGSGIISAIFNIGYTLALPISDTGVRLGVSRFAATNCIWLLMLAAGSLPNLVFCYFRMRKNKTQSLLIHAGGGKAWGLCTLMGLLWGGSIFLYGAATPLLGDMGPSIGWPLSLAVGLLVANLMGVWLGEWRQVNPEAKRYMQSGIAVILVAILLCAAASKLGVS
jgi:L-rhamnose-H+ transport protein